jgi:peptidoglycan/LPS O-acetylase OafA/YrhL
MYFNGKSQNLIARLPSYNIILVYAFFVAVILFQDDIFSESQLVIEFLLFQLFGVFIILEQNYATNSFIKVGKLKWVTALGKYSYGFFCYHIICIRFVETIAYKLGMHGAIAEVIIIPLTSLLLTVLIGIASYHLFEIHFLNWKRNFTYLK